MVTKLFCIPHAGGSATMYNRWKTHINNHLIEVVPVELAGRGSRINEDFYCSFAEAVDDIVSFMKKNIGSSYAVLGHSMGSWIAYEACCKIKEEMGLEPKHIFFAGNTPPHLPKNEIEISKLNDSEFEKEIIGKGGTPKELFEDAELKSIFVPIIKADYKLIEDYKYENKGIKFDCDISVLNGQDDSLELDDLMQWGDYTRKNFTYEEFEGGHFFVHDKYKEIIEKINSILTPA